jgi:hypothetical protein
LERVIQLIWIQLMTGKIEFYNSLLISIFILCARATWMIVWSCWVKSSQTQVIFLSLSIRVTTSLQQSRLSDKLYISLPSCFFFVTILVPWTSLDLSFFGTRHFLNFSPNLLLDFWLSFTNESKSLISQIFSFLWFAVLQYCGLSLMGRNKITIQRIENERNRQVCALHSLIFQCLFNLSINFKDILESSFSRSKSLFELFLSWLFVCLNVTSYVLKSQDRTQPNMYYFLILLLCQIRQLSQREKTAW